MLTKSITPETTEFNGKQLPIIRYQGTPVATTAMLAEMYGTDEVRVRQNYSNNKEKFTEGKHFFMLKGEELRKFKKTHPEVSPRVNALTLWTLEALGVFTKTIDTPVAWKILEMVSDYERIIAAIESFEVPDDLPDLYVYAIREIDTGNIKIGISRDPESRLKQMQTGNSSELELVAYRKAENRYADERALHADAEAHRLRGEWFNEQALEVLH